MIRKNSDGTPDILISLSPTAPTVPSGWTRVQRLGGDWTTTGGDLLPFSQSGTRFLLGTPIVILASTATRAAAPLSIISPSGVGSLAVINLKPIAATGQVLVMQGDDFDARALGALYQSFEINASANASRQITLAVVGSPNASTNWELASRGWIDYTLAKIGA